MEAFLKVCGELRVASVVAVIAAIVFMVKILSVVRNYLHGKWELEKQKKDKFNEVLKYVEKYPEWHQESVNIRDGMNEKIDSNSEKIEEMYNLMFEKIEGIHTSMKSLETATHEGLALTWRYRILRFNDEVKQGIRHTEEHFTQILEDITNYNSYCDNHPEFPNDKAVFAIENIRRVYIQCLEEDDFL